MVEMHSLGQALQAVNRERLMAALPSVSDGRPSELPPEASRCAVCNGVGWVILDSVPFGAPNWGKAVPCKCQPKPPRDMGRTFENYLLSAPIGATAVGLIEEMPGADPATEIWLQANGMGATVTVRLTVW